MDDVDHLLCENVAKDDFKWPQINHFTGVFLCKPFSVYMIYKNRYFEINLLFYNNSQLSTMYKTLCVTI